eukprot:g13378.t1
MELEASSVLPSAGGSPVPRWEQMASQPFRELERAKWAVANRGTDRMAFKFSKAEDFRKLTTMLRDVGKQAAGYTLAAMEVQRDCPPEKAAKLLWRKELEEAQEDRKGKTKGKKARKAARAAKRNLEDDSCVLSMLYEGSQEKNASQTEALLQMEATHKAELEGEKEKYKKLEIKCNALKEQARPLSKAAADCLKDWTCLEHVTRDRVEVWGLKLGASWARKHGRQLVDRHPSKIPPGAIVVGTPAAVGRGVRKTPDIHELIAKVDADGAGMVDKEGRGEVFYLSAPMKANRREAAKIFARWDPAQPKPTKGAALLHALKGAARGPLFGDAKKTARAHDASTPELRHEELRRWDSESLATVVVFVLGWVVQPDGHGEAPRCCRLFGGGRSGDVAPTYDANGLREMLHEGNAVWCREGESIPEGKGGPSSNAGGTALASGGKRQQKDQDETDKKPAGSTLQKKNEYSAEQLESAKANNVATPAAATAARVELVGSPSVSRARAGSS